MNAPNTALLEIARVLKALRERETGLSAREADLVDDLERFLLDCEATSNEADEGRRDYRYTAGPKRGRKMSGVTGLMKANLGWPTQPLTRWAAREAATAAVEFMLEGAAPADAAHRAKFAPFGQRDGAAEIGKLAHEMIVAFLLERPFTPDPFLPSTTINAAGACLRKFLAWWDSRVWEVLACELPLTDEECGFGGTIDLVLRRRVDNAVIVADLKTGKGIHDDTLVQLGGYALLLLRHKREWTPIGGGLVIHVPAMPIVGPTGELIDAPLKAVPVGPETIAIASQAFTALTILHAARKQLTLSTEIAA